MSKIAHNRYYKMSQKILHGDVQMNKRMNSILKAHKYFSKLCLQITSQLPHFPRQGLYPWIPSQMLYSPSPGLHPGPPFNCLAFLEGALDFLPYHTYYPTALSITIYNTFKDVK